METIQKTKRNTTGKKQKLINGESIAENNPIDSLSEVNEVGNNETIDTDSSTSLDPK